MFSKIWASGVLISALCLQVAAHAIVTPALGVKGIPSRADVQRPNAANPCGAGVTNISSAINTATTVPAGASGSFQLNATSFNGGTDGSLEFKGQVDPTGTGKHFVPMTITTNGNNSPPGAESQTIVATLPPGTKCTGGMSGNLCLAQFVSGAKFGNCAVVSQTTADAGAPTTAAGNPKAVANPATKTAGGCPAKNSASTASSAAFVATPRAGSLMARSLLADLGNLGEGAVEIAKRDTSIQAKNGL